MAGKGSSGFDLFYSSRIGDRWKSLREALLRPPIKIEAASGQLIDQTTSFPALALDVRPGDRVLEMCAGPGDKSGIIAGRIGDSGELVANEFSDRRRASLEARLQLHVPAQVLGRIRIMGPDAASGPRYENNSFDRVLLDAPCSDERYVLTNPIEIKKWTEARTKSLSLRQYALLAAALSAVRNGGRIVYTTCSVSPRENDEVIAHLLKRHSGEVSVLGFERGHHEASRFQPPIGEATEFGWAILPDVCGGAGPLYMATLQRTA